MIVRTDIPTTWQVSSQAMEDLASTYPQFRLQTLALTPGGRSLNALVIGQGERTVFFSGAYHANEWITATLLLKFAEEYAQALNAGGRIFGVPAHTLFDAATIHILPMVNPDGVDLVTGAILPESEEYLQAKALSDNYPGISFPQGWKADLQGVDLNLQFPAGWLQAREIKFSQGYTRPGPRDYVGRYPLSQVEARAVASYTRDINPALVLAFHTQGEVIYWQFQDIQVPGARALGEEFARLSGYSLEDTPYESSFAGYKDWFIKTYLRPGYTIEVGQGENPLPLSQFDDIYRKNLGILVTAATGLPTP